jgi:O-antigen/teichoic acid export membrane protein
MIYINYQGLFCRFGLTTLRTCMLSKHLISSVLVQIPVFILGVAAGVFSTRILGDEGKGVFSLFQANSQLFVLIFSFGIQTGIVYFVSSKKISEPLVAGMSISIFFISSFILLVILAISYFGGFAHLLLSETHASAYYLLLLFLLYFFTFLNSILSSFLQAHSKFRITNLVSLINSIFNAGIFTALYFLLDHPIFGPAEKLNYVLYTTLVVLVFNSFLWAYFYNKYITIKPNFNFKMQDGLKPFLLYNSAIFIGTLINFLNYRLDLWIVNNYLPEKDLSYYSLAANINQIILYISVTISTVMLPNLSGKNEADRTRTFIQISRISFSFFIVICLIAFFVSDFIIPLVYGDEFTPSIIPFKIIIPGVLFSCCTQLFATLIVACKRNLLNIIATGIGLVLTLILDLTLIPRYEIKGAAYATVICYSAVFICTFYLSLKKLNMPFTNYFFITAKDYKLVKENIQLLFK